MLEICGYLPQICRVAGDYERFKVVTTLALKILPEETTALNSIVASMEQQWKTEGDVSLASKLISYNMETGH